MNHQHGAHSTLQRRTHEAGWERARADGPYDLAD